MDPSQLPTFKGVFLIPWTLSPSSVVCVRIRVYRSLGTTCLVFFVCVHMCIQALRKHPPCVLRPGVCWPGWCQGSVCLPQSRARIMHSQPQVQLFFSSSGTRTLVLTLVWQVLYQQSCYPSHAHTNWCLTE